MASPLVLDRDGRERGGVVRATNKLPIRALAAGGGPGMPKFKVTVLDEAGSCLYDEQIEAVGPPDRRQIKLASVDQGAPLIILDTSLTPAPFAAAAATLAP